MKLALGVEPGWVEIIPLNLVTVHDLTWLYSEHTDTRYFSDRATLVTGDLEKTWSMNGNNSIVALNKRKT